MGYGLGAAALVLISILILWKKWNQKVLPNTPERVSFSLTSSSGPVEADGNMDEFTITVENRYTYLVRDGVIVAYKDSSKNHEFKEYSEVNADGTF
jgi:hypothetical protein